MPKKHPLPRPASPPPWPPGQPREPNPGPAQPEPRRTNPSPPPQRRRPAARAATVPLSDPVTQERMAAWVEARYSEYPRLVRQEAAWLAAHPDDGESKGRLAWYKNALSAARAIAYMIRTFQLEELPGGPAAPPAAPEDTAHGAPPS